MIEAGTDTFFRAFSYIMTAPIRSPRSCFSRPDVNSSAACGKRCMQGPGHPHFEGRVVVVERLIRAGCAAGHMLRRTCWLHCARCLAAHLPESRHTKDWELRSGCAVNDLHSSRHSCVRFWHATLLTRARSPQSVPKRCSAACKRPV